MTGSGSPANTEREAAAKCAFWLMKKAAEKEGSFLRTLFGNRRPAFRSVTICTNTDVASISKEAIACFILQVSVVGGLLNRCFF
jgi:hypothetical protein